jgi:alkanesulfonate monooxygenase
MLRYYDLGITRLLLRGFDPLLDAEDLGRRLLPLLRAGVEQRDGGGPAGAAGAAGADTAAAEVDVA